MGYHTGSDIPNYWTYARRLRAPGPHVRAGRVVEPSRAPLHGLGVVGHVHQHNDPLELHEPDQTRSSRVDREPGRPERPIYAWTDMTYLLHKNKVSWGYYVVPGPQPDCAERRRSPASPVPQVAETPSIWNPLPYFDTVQNDNQLGNIQSISNFYSQAAGRHAARRLVGRAVAGRQRAPAGADQRRSVVRHEPRQRGDAQPRLELDRDLPRVGRLGRLLRPRRAARVDANGYGLRVPGIVISPYAKARLHRPPDAAASTRTTSSSRTTSSAASASTPRPTAGPTHARRARERHDPRRPQRRLRLHADAARRP